MLHQSPWNYQNPLRLSGKLACLRPRTWLLQASIQRRLISITRQEYPSKPQLLTVRNIPAPHIGHIRVIGLNSPHNRNAISQLLLAELHAQVQRLRLQDGRRGGTRVLILASEIDEAFCAGADLKERAQMSHAETRQFLTLLRSTLTDLSHLNIPTISVVTSLALGGGFELALATSLRLFSNTATVSFPEVRLGIIPGAGGTYRLRKLIGESRAQQYILTGHKIKGYEAFRVGICNWLVNVRRRPDEMNKGVNEMPLEQEPESMAAQGFLEVPDPSKIRGRVLEVAVKVAESICNGAPVAVGAAFNAVKGAHSVTEDTMYERCLKIGATDRAEGLNAFKEKRAPHYRGVSGGLRKVDDENNKSSETFEQSRNWNTPEKRAKVHVSGNNDNTA